MMFSNISRTQAIGTWVATVTVLMMASLVAGMEITIGNSALWFIAGAVPAVIALLLWHRAPPVTIADVLYSDTPSKKTAGDGHRPSGTR